MSAHDRLLAAANQRALEIVALPLDEREGRYESMKVEHFGTAGALGLPGEAAQELVDQMDRTIKRLVATLEHGGEIDEV